MGSGKEGNNNNHDYTFLAHIPTQIPPIFHLGAENRYFLKHSYMVKNAQGSCLEL